MQTHADAPSVADPTPSNPALYAAQPPDAKAAKQFQAAAFVTTVPQQGDVAAALSSGPHVQVAFASAQVSALGLLEGSAPASGTSPPQAYTAAAFAVDVSTVTSPHDLLLGFHDPQQLTLNPNSPAPFDALEVKITVANKVISDTNLTTVSAALQYLTDHLIDLGPAYANGSGSNQFQADVALAVTAHSPGTGVLAGFVVGTVPTLAGDANHDGVVDFADLVALAQHYGLGGARQWRRATSTATDPSALTIWSSWHSTTGSVYTCRLFH